jgi:hypothetical protein
LLTQKSSMQSSSTTDVGIVNGSTLESSTAQRWNRQRLTQKSLMKIESCRLRNRHHSPVLRLTLKSSAHIGYCWLRNYWQKRSRCRLKNHQRKLSHCRFRNYQRQGESFLVLPFPWTTRKVYAMPSSLHVSNPVEHKCPQSHSVHHILSSNTKTTSPMYIYQGFSQFITSKTST